MATAITPRSQIRLKSVSGSIASISDMAVSDYSSPLASNSINASTLQDILAAMAGSISRIHGVGDFTNAQAGVFSNATSVFSGSLSLKDGSGVQKVSITNAGVISGSSSLQAGGALTVALGSTLVGNVDALAGLDVTGADLTVGTDKFTVAVGTGNVASKGTLDVDGDATLASAIVEDLTAGKVALVGTGKRLAVDAEISHSAGTLTVSGSTFSKDVTIARDLTVTRDISAVSGTFTGKLTVGGDLVVNGTTTTVNSTVVTVDDINIELGATASPSDVSANGGGIILKGNTDHTIVWDNATDSWVFSENLLASADASKDLGSSSVKWKNLYLSGDANVNGALDVNGAADVQGALNLQSTLTVASASTFNGAADFNSGITVNSVKIDGDTATRLYVVDTDGSIKDEANLMFHDSKLYVTGGLDVSAAAHFASTFDVDSTSTFGDDVTLDKSGKQVVGKTGGDLLVSASSHLSMSAASDIIVEAARDLVAEVGDDFLISVASVMDVNVGGNFALDADNVDLRAADGVLFASASSDVHIAAGADLKFLDSNKSPGWSDADGIKLSDASAEWDRFKTVFGEVSILSAISTAAALPGDSRFMFKIDSAVSAPASILGSDLKKINGTHFSGSYTSVPTDARDENVKLYLNGQLLVSKSFDASNYDYDIASDGTSVSFNFALQKDDFVVAFLPVTLASLVGYTTGGGGAGGGSSVVDIGGDVSGKPAAGEVIFRAPVSVAVTLDGGYAYCDTAATATATFNIQKGVNTAGTISYSNVGTIVYSAGSSVGAVSYSGGSVSYAAGNIVRVVAPSSADSTLADISFTLSGNEA